MQRENAAFWKRIQELEPSRISQGSLSRVGDPDALLIEELKQLGDFTSEQARVALSSSNNDLEAAANFLLSPGLSPRICLDECEQRPVMPRRGRGGNTPLRGGYTPQPPRSSLSPFTSVSGHNAMVPAALSAASGQADREQLAPTLAQYTGECAIGTTEEYWLRPGSWNGI